MFSLGTRFQLIRDAIRNQLGKVVDDDRGVTMLEYTILIGIITVAVILAVIYAGSWVTSQWQALTSALQSA